MCAHSSRWELEDGNRTNSDLLPDINYVNNCAITVSNGNSVWTDEGWLKNLMHGASYHNVGKNDCSHPGAAMHRWPPSHWTHYYFIPPIIKRWYSLHTRVLYSRMDDTRVVCNHLRIIQLFEYDTAIWVHLEFLSIDFWSSNRHAMHMSPPCTGGLNEATWRCCVPTCLSSLWKLVQWQRHVFCMMCLI